MKSLHFYLLLITILLGINSAQSQVLAPQKDNTRNVISLNGIWKFQYIPSLNIGNNSVFYRTDFNYSKWPAIKVPGCWELQGFADPEYAGNLKEGTGLYLTTFNVPQNWKRQSVYLAFDGVCYGYDLWVNGQHAGSFASSYNRQTFDITKHIIPEKINTLAVKVSTRPMGYDFDVNDDWSLSGIIRDVTLFTLPQTHLQDLTVRTFVRDKKNASISIAAFIERNKIGPSGNAIKISGKLTDKAGKQVKVFSINGNFETGKDTLTLSKELQINNPELWTAETPYLYGLNVDLYSNNKKLESQNPKIGIREISIENGILNLNGSPIKLRGIDHHDLSPINGRAISKAEIKQDLILIKKANVNFIRTSHYPPNRYLIELCDSMGIYVDDEVPFGYGDPKLSDTSYLPILLRRAKTTLLRDKNSPSIIVWSIGNENPLTEITMETGRYVKQLDPTRPYCFPQMGSYFKKIANDFPDKDVEILSPHYPTPGDLREYASTKFHQPFIITEYAHDFGLEFDGVEVLSEIIHESPTVAGGAVWHFEDQGLLRKADKPVDVTKFTPYVWLDSVTYYDCYKDNGTDGIVYSNRVPQVDYWELRKVFSPIKALGESTTVKPGKRAISIQIENRYDFKNLSETRLEWELFADTTLIQKGNKSMVCTPHDTAEVKLNVDLPKYLNAFYYLLKLKFFDKDDYQFYEKVYQLHSEQKNFLNKFSFASQVDNKQLFYSNPSSGTIEIKNSNNTPVILDGPYLRVGRKYSLSNWSRKEADGTDSVDTGANDAWFPPNIKNPEIESETGSGNNISYNYKYTRAHTNQFIEGSVDYHVSDSGWVDVNYNFKPVNATGLFLESGITFLAPKNFTEFRWIGQGPYASYPGKSQLDEFGFYHKNSGDINFLGNYSGVNMALITDSIGNGFIIYAKDANIAVEKTKDGLLVSHNAMLSGRYSKKNLPLTRINGGNVKEIAGSFTIIPVTKDWSKTLEHLFGKPNHTAKPFRPFYYSYDE